MLLSSAAALSVSRPRDFCQDRTGHWTSDQCANEQAAYCRVADEKLATETW